MITVEELKGTDWLIGESLQTGEKMIRRVNTCLLHLKEETESIPNTIDERDIKRCKYKYLTIKPEVIQPNMVIHCPEEWMAKALLWAADRLGYKWDKGSSYLDYTHWVNKKVCYHLHNATHTLYGEAEKFGYKIIPFWDAITGEETKGKK